MGRRINPARLLEVETALAAHEPRTTIIERLTHEWGVSVRQLRRYIAEVDRMWIERGAADIEARRIQYTETAHELLRRAIRKGHERTAREIVDMLARWYGIGTTQVTSVVYSAQGKYTNSASITKALGELRQQQLASGDDGDDN